MKDRYLAHGIDGFQDHEVLELLLYYAIPRGDTNSLAHELLRQFGSLAAVMEASPADLIKVPGIGENAAIFLNMLPKVLSRYQISRQSMGSIIKTSRQAGKFLTPYFYGETTEVIYMACLDTKCKVINVKPLGKGGLTYAAISTRSVVENALACNAAAVILAHNHPGGLALPSSDDIVATRRIAAALDAVEIKLADHIIIANDDFVSLADSGKI